MIGIPLEVDDVDISEVLRNDDGNVEMASVRDEVCEDLSLPVCVTCPHASDGNPVTTEIGRKGALVVIVPLDEQIGVSENDGVKLAPGILAINLNIRNDYIPSIIALLLGIDGAETFKVSSKHG